MMLNPQDEKFFEENMRLVYYIINRYFPDCMYDEDAKQEALLSFARSIKAYKYDNKGVSFNTFAGYRLKTTLRNYVGKQKKIAKTKIAENELLRRTPLFSTMDENFIESIPEHLQGVAKYLIGEKKNSGMPVEELKKKKEELKQWMIEQGITQNTE